ncbi:MAG: hypothetical protein KDA20_06540 [Phycisphaerales bacterium]|nr:hypothetical protein [Phycisphaerales bacterium]
MIDKSALTRGAFRKGADQPMANIGGFMQRCNDCHQLFTSEMDQTRPLAQHGHIHLEHGINNNCANCHAREDREKLILRGGVEIAFSETPRLCQQCHGPVYADWLRGTHGKTMGSWQTGSPDQVRLRCTECHDPHAPAYKPMAPLPSPNTLRMGWQGPIVEHGAERNPLRRWLAPEVHETGAPAQHGTHKGDPETPAGRQEGEH